MAVSLIRFGEHGGIAFVTVHGAIDHQLTSQLRDVLAWAVDNHDGAIVDLSGVAGIDRSGLGVLLQSQDRAHLRATSLCFAAPSAAMLTDLTSLNADAMFPMFDDCAGAATWLRTTPQAA